MVKQALQLGLVILISASSLLTSCESDYSTTEIARVSDKESLTLKYKNNRAKIHKIEIIINGNINGNATIYQKDEHSFVKPIELEKGELDVVLIGEWYSTTCILDYDPGTSTEGRIDIKYKFYKF